MSKQPTPEKALNAAPSSGHNYYNHTRPREEEQEAVNGSTQNLNFNPSINRRYSSILSSYKPKRTASNNFVLSATQLNQTVPGKASNAALDPTNSAVQH